MAELTARSLQMYSGLNHQPAQLEKDSEEAQRAYGGVGRFGRLAGARVVCHWLWGCGQPNGGWVVRMAMGAAAGAPACLTHSPCWPA